MSRFVEKSPQRKQTHYEKEKAFFLPKSLWSWGEENQQSRSLALQRKRVKKKKKNNWRKKKKKKNGAQNWILHKNHPGQSFTSSLQTHFSVERKGCEGQREDRSFLHLRGLLKVTSPTAACSQSEKSGNFWRENLGQPRKTQNLFTFSRTNSQQLLEFSQLNFMSTPNMLRLRWSWCHSIPHDEGYPSVWFSLILALL